MSDIIRAVRGGWTPPPRPNSFDVRSVIVPDNYRFAQNEVESAQRVNQTAVNRTIRAGNINTAPQAPAIQPNRIPSFLPTTIITLPVN